MKTSQDKVLNALASLIPEDAREKASAAISDFLKEAVADLEGEYESKLEEAYATLTEEKAVAEKVAEKGYAEAYEIICDLRDRLEVQKEEYEQQLIEGYEEAYQMLLAERGKNDTLEVDLYEEYDNRLSEVKEFIVDKVDAFLAQKGDEFFEMAKKEVINDPTMAEHKVALDRILEVAAYYLSDDDYTYASNSRAEEMTRSLEEIKGQIKILEARNMRLTTDNQKLLTENKGLKDKAHEVLTEGTRVERNARKELAKKAESRGQRVTDDVKVIAEHQKTAGETVATDDQDPSQKLFREWRTLAAIPEAQKS